MGGLAAGIRKGANFSAGNLQGSDRLPLPREPRGRACPGSLGRVFDHVGIAVLDLAASERFYRTVLSVLDSEPSHADAELVEWDDWAIGPTDREHPVTRGLHVGFRARDRAQVDAFWQAGIDAGYRDDGAPGPRTQYGPTYYGGFLLDPDGNSVEAVLASELLSGARARAFHINAPSIRRDSDGQQAAAEQVGEACAAVEVDVPELLQRSNDLGDPARLISWRP